MLVLNPALVRFAGEEWEDVVAVAVDRLAQRAVEEWGDFGPYAVLADVPEQSVRVQVRQRLARGSIGSPRPGDEGDLEFWTAPGASEGGRLRISARAVVRSVTHEWSERSGAVRTVMLVAIDPFVSGEASGSTDPIRVEEAEGGS